MEATDRKAITGGGEMPQARTGGLRNWAWGDPAKLPEAATLGLHLKKRHEVLQAGRGWGWHSCPPGQAGYSGLQPLVSGENHPLLLNLFNPETHQELVLIGSLTVRTHLVILVWSCWMASRSLPADSSKMAACGKGAADQGETESWTLVGPQTAVCTILACTFEFQGIWQGWACVSPPEEGPWVPRVGPAGHRHLGKSATPVGHDL